MAEEVKRLTPKKEILRELYLKSGNQCAFPGCVHVMIDSVGNFVGQICHIEAAEVGGERFNQKMTNEERRAFSNLMLMCYDHHIVTNNVAAYPVKRLQQMKTDHEAKFTDIAGVIRGSIIDHTKLVTATHSSSLTRYCEVFDLIEGYISPPLSEIVKQFNEFADQLSRLPLSTRELLVILVERTEEYDLSPANQGMRVLPSEIELVTGLTTNKLNDHLNILKQHQLTWTITCDDDGIDIPYIFLRHRSGVNMWLDIKYFCAQTDTPLAEIIENLQFHLLD
ncbi:MAG: hypothetical protein L0287_28770 [Anaerolineae bacterium]|nr:hypothetical protein [Anaerolineae bacterium]